MTDQRLAYHSPLGSAILVGFGSVGSFLGKVLTSRYNQLAVVARTDATHVRLAEALPEANAARSLEELDAIGWDWSDSLAVIATWGPTHASYFHSLVDRGVRHVLCEKPLADSVFNGEGMISRARETGVALGTHQQRAYSGLVPGLQNIARQLDLGHPVSLIVHGGAVGLVTMGVHYIGFACELFGARPTRVVSTAQGDPINPRSPDLMYYGGTAVWSFEDSRETVFCFNNQSSVGPTVMVEYRNAIATLGANDTVVVLHRDEAQLVAYPQVTRTGNASKILYDGPIPGLLTSEQATISVIKEVEQGDVRKFPPEDALQAVGACIGALSSGASRQAVSLPIEPSSEIGRRRWPIS